MDFDSHCEMDFTCTALSRAICATPTHPKHMACTHSRRLAKCMLSGSHSEQGYRRSAHARAASRQLQHNFPLRPRWLWLMCAIPTHLQRISSIGHAVPVLACLPACYPDRIVRVTGDPPTRERPADNSSLISPLRPWWLWVMCIIPTHLQRISGIVHDLPVVA